MIRKNTLFLMVVFYMNTYSVTKTHISPAQIEQTCMALHANIIQDNFMPDLIIGLARGGLVPLAYLAGEKMFDMRNTLSLGVQSYEHDKQGEISLLLPLHAQDIQQYKNILIVDDIVDSGKTFAFVTNLIINACPHATIKTAALYYKPLRSVVRPDYYAIETDDWIVFPWESELR